MGFVLLKSSFTIEEIREMYMKAYNDNKLEIDARINDGIEKYRKGYCRIRVIDKNGKPLKKQKVRITQTKHDFKYGANIFMLDQFESELDNAEYRRFFKEYFNLATVPFYWDTLEPDEGKPRYSVESPKTYRRPAPDLCMNYCEENNISAKLHCLIFENFVPEWFKELSIEEKSIKLEERIRQIAERYSGRMYEFEVVNELLCIKPGSKLGYNKDIPKNAFAIARKYLPNETLVINEAQPLITAELRGYYHHYFLMIENAILKGATIDKIGFQNHCFVGGTSKNNEEYDKSLKGCIKYNDPMLYFRALDIFTDFGLPLEFTEVTIPTFGDTEEYEELQADMLKLWYSVWFSHPLVETIVYWNTVDGFCYAPNENWDENRCRGGLFHHDLTPKKSALMLKKLFDEIWHTDMELYTDENGYADFRGFYGEYNVEIDGKDKKFDLHKNVASANVFDITI